MLGRKSSHNILSKKGLKLKKKASRLSRDREVVMPARAGIQNFLKRREISNWIPAFAGMTAKVLIPKCLALSGRPRIISSPVERLDALAS